MILHHLTGLKTEVDSQYKELSVCHLYQLFKGRNPVPPSGEWLQYETISRWSLTTV